MLLDIMHIVVVAYVEVALYNFLMNKYMRRISKSRNYFIAYYVTKEEYLCVLIHGYAQSFERSHEQIILYVLICKYC